MKKKTMPEKEYRASRICRVLGNPTAYRIMKLLKLKKKKTPSILAEEINSTISNVSKTLRQLRQIDLVRYDTERNEKRYYLKDRNILNLLHSLEDLVNKIKFKE